MSPTTLVLGVLLGAAMVGAGVFCVILLSRLKMLTDTLAPITKNGEVIKALQSFEGLLHVGTVMCQKMDVLHKIITDFYQVAIQKPVSPETEMVPASSIVAGYSEAEAAARFASQEAKKAANSEDDSRIPRNENEVDVF
jgi:hypothetical protein